MSRFAIRRRYAASRPFVRHPAQFELFDFVTDATAVDGMAIPPWRGLPAWHRELDRQSATMRPRRPLYRRFDTSARQLTAERIRACLDTSAIARLVERLSAARYPSGALHDLDRVWSRAELGALLVEATNRRTLLAMGRDRPRAKGPALDPRRLPDDRLDHLIQTHRDISVVETLRAERERRASCAASIYLPHDRSINMGQESPARRPAIRAVSFEDVGAALARLVPIALPPTRAAETGASSKVADFLLAWWNGDDTGHFPILHLCNVDAVTAEDMLIIMAYLAENSTVYADKWGYRDTMAEIWERYRGL